MTPVLVLNVAGLTRELLSRFPERAKNIVTLASEGSSCLLSTGLPAVTCPVQATFLTGLMPAGHGIVGNGWYFREEAAVHFWEQSNTLVQGEKIWQAAKKRDKDFTSAQLFWWFNMHSGNDFAVTPRPAHLPDGSLISLTYTDPPELAHELDKELGRFPLFKFWGPDADIASSEWIEKCALHCLHRFAPTLTLVYLPHLDYNLQRLGPHDHRIGADLEAVDQVVGRLSDEARAKGIEVVILSEYGMTQVAGAIDINRVLRRAGYLRAHQQAAWELLDCGASRAFAVSDHQVAHVYVNNARDISAVKALLETTPGIERVLDQSGLKAAGVAHPRAGELLAISEASYWFTYYYWEDDALAPPWAHEVEIHAKPGYDPLELFIDPHASFVIPRILWRLLMRKLDLRVTVMDFIPFDATLVQGSHGRLPDNPENGPLLITTRRQAPLPEKMPATEVKDFLLKMIFGG